MKMKIKQENFNIYGKKNYIERATFIEIYEAFLDLIK